MGRIMMRNMAGLNAALRALPKEMSAELRDESQDIAAAIAGDAASRAMSLGGAARLVAPTIKARRDRVPVIAMGSSTRLRKGPRQTVGDVIFGAEFGGKGRPTTQQFRPHLGTTGYFLWPTIRDRLPWAMDQWLGALEDGAIKAAGRGR